MSESLAIETVHLRKRLDATASVGIRKRTGFVDEHKALYDYMTVEEISGDVTAAIGTAPFNLTRTGDAQLTGTPRNARSTKRSNGRGTAPARLCRCNECCWRTHAHVHAGSGNGAAHRAHAL